MKIANSMLTLEERRNLYTVGEQIDPGQIRVGMVVVNCRGEVRMVAAHAPPGEALPDPYRARAPGGDYRNQIVLSPGGSGVGGPEALARRFRDVTAQVYERLG